MIRGSLLERNREELPGKGGRRGCSFFPIFVVDMYCTHRCTFHIATQRLTHSFGFSLSRVDNDNDDDDDDD